MKASDEKKWEEVLQVALSASRGDDQLLSDIVMSICRFHSYMYMYIETGGSDAYFDC